MLIDIHSLEDARKTSPPNTAQANILNSSSSEIYKIVQEETEMLKSASLIPSTVQTMKVQLQNTGIFLVTGGLGSLGIEVKTGIYLSKKLDFKLFFLLLEEL